MAKRSGIAALVALLVPAAVLVPVAVAAGGPAGSGQNKAGQSAAGQNAAGQNAAGQSGAGSAASSASSSSSSSLSSGSATGEDPATQFGRACAEGTAKFLGQDYKGALASFQEAVRIAPKNPYGHYLSAEANLALGDLAEAESALKRAEASTDGRSALLRSKVLFVTAIVKERASKWDEAKAAWQAYSDWVFKSVDAGGTFPMSAAARIKTVDEAARREKAMETVRTRIDASAGGTIYNEMGDKAR